MAKKDDKAKIRFIFVEMEGSNAALESSVKDVVKAISQPARRPRPSLPPSAQQQQLPDGAEQAEFDFDVEDADYEDVEVTDDKPKPKKKRSAPKLNVLDLDLEAGSPTLKEFYDTKSPTNHSHRYLSIMYWLTEHLDIESIGVDHIYTCYRFLQLSVPSDVGQVFRDMAKTDRGYVTRTERGHYRINHIGENLVNGLGVDGDGA